ncbi:MFS transporter, partial [Chloroflexota bacterium]
MNSNSLSKDNLHTADNTPPPQKTKGFFYRWVVLVILFAIGVINFGVRFSFGVFFKSIQEEFSWSRASISGIYSTYLVLCAVFAILAGWALDRYGPRVVLTAMGFFTALSLSLTSQVSSPWQLFITYSSLLAIGTGGTYVVLMATVNRWFIRRRGLALGIVGSGTNTGMIIMGPLSAYLISAYSWQTASLLIGLIAFFIVIPCGLLLRRSPGETASLPHGDRLEATNCGAPLEQPGNRPEGLSLHQTVRTMNFWLLVFIMFLFASCVYVVMTHLVPHAIDLDIPPIQAASLLSFVGGGGIAGKLVMGRVSDSIGRKRAYMICPLLMVGAMLWLVKSSDLLMLYLFAIVFGFAYGGFGAVNAALF